MGEVKDISELIICTVCPSIKRRDKWYNVGEEAVKALKNAADKHEPCYRCEQNGSYKCH